jgi:hypothetical protein
MVARWLAETEPDVVALAANDYWFNFDSAPEHLRRKFGRPGAVVADFGARIGRTQWLAERRAFQFCRRRLTNLIGGESLFEPDEVVAAMRDAIMVLVRSESVTPIVAGPISVAGDDKMTPAQVARRKARRRQVDDGLKSICEAHHITYFGLDSEMARAMPIETLLGDGLHPDAEGHNAWLKALYPILKPILLREAQRSAGEVVT